MYMFIDNAAIVDRLLTLSRIKDSNDGIYMNISESLLSLIDK